MFERLLTLGERRALERAEARRAGLAGRLGEALPRGIQANAEPAGVVLAGRGLRRRLTELGWLIAGAIR